VKGIQVVSENKEIVGGAGGRIAVVGISCRLPGAADPTEFWELLRAGRDAVTTIPAARLDDYAGQAGAPLVGGFLPVVDEFDPEFFGLDPQEAVAADPHQRLALELAWEAFEDARWGPGRPGGEDVGVFLGMTNGEFPGVVGRLGPTELGRYSFAGMNRAIIANRVSHALGLVGPSYTVDSAQSSALSAVHLACQSLLAGECAAALAGGVNLLLSAEGRLAVERLGALSPHGRSFTFDHRASGFVRGEGGALILLEPLERALALGHRVHAVILASAANNDGATDGLTTPSAAAQEAVIRRALRRARLTGAEVSYVELHGTGTRVGDPIEAAALGAAYGQHRPADDPLLVGSVKTNIGHLEGAAGIAGLLKVVLSLRHRHLPPSLHFERPHPDIDLDGWRLRVIREGGAWPHPDRPLIGGVSSFGMGGTNAHLLLAEAAADTGRYAGDQHAGDQEVPSAAAPGRTRPALFGAWTRLTAPDQPLAWVLSAPTESSLTASAARLAATAGQTCEPGDVALSLATTRAVHAHRAVVLGADRAGLLDGLRALGKGAQHAGLLRSAAVGDGCVVLVFPGQGSQWPGMARALLDTSPVFAEHLTSVCAALADHLDVDLLDLLRAPGAAPASPALERVDVIQPALFAVHVALARMWEAAGLRPAGLIGHSQGEIAAAHVAGALDLATAARIVAVRSRAVVSLAGTGGMASVLLPVADVRARLRNGDYPSLTVAAVNGPRMTVLSGATDDIRGLVEGYRADGVRARVVAVDYPSHGPGIAAVRSGLLADLRDVTAGAGRVALYSTVTGGRLESGALTADYWYRNLREPVDFDAAVRAAYADGHRLFLECSAHPVLTLGIEDILADLERATSSRSSTGAASGRALATLRRERGGPDRFLTALAEAWTAGAHLDWDTVMPADAHLVDLPTAAFVRRQLRPGGATPAATGQPEPARPPVDSAGAVHAAVALVLGRAELAAADATVTFQDLGLDSAGAVELHRRLTDATGLFLSPAVVYDHPTPSALAAHVRAELSARPGDEPVTPSPSVASPGPDDPVAIVAVSGRWPGADSPQALWDLLLDGRESTGDFPADRGWDLESLLGPASGGGGRSRTGTGGFLADAGAFDAAFFGISPREATAMDPQQRLLLESAWELFERAGLRPAALRGGRTGVFVGVTPNEYGPRLHEMPDSHAGHGLTGSLPAVASGRLAYVFGLLGPAVTVDTACSSSMVAIHLAVRALRAGECELALAGGAAVLATPGLFTEFSRQQGLAADGRCKPFSAAADGTAWSEGVGLLLLERLSDARRQGHPVLALIRGTAVNSDGASNGLTAPSGLSQQAVIRAALADAGLGPADVDALEGHGTGTALGDPVEAQAVIAAYGRGRAPDRPLWLGSLKANIGHSQAAAGVTGVVKMVRALREGVLPRSLHADTPSSFVDWSGGSVALLADTTLWPSTGRPRRAAVSSFGISGTNTHIILEQAPPAEPGERRPARAEADATGPVPLVVSAKNPDALADQAVRLADHLAASPDSGGGDTLVGTARALATTRTVFAHRRMVLARDRADAIAGLRELAGAQADPDDAVTTRGGPTAFLFSGQGSQYAGMARGLLRAAPAFAAAFDEVAGAFDGMLEHPLGAVVRADPTDELAGLLDQTGYTQPALFALHVALWRYVQPFGPRPDYLFGHSIGELSAAHLAGVLSLPDAVTLVAARSRLMQALPAGGVMVALQGRESDVAPLLAGQKDRVALAAVNGPTSVVVSGAADAVLALARRWRDGGGKTKRLDTSHAFHSPLMEPMLARFREVAAGLTYAAPSIPVVSNLTGELAGAELTDPEYWVRHVRATVRFHAGARMLLGRGVRRFLELGPGPVLCALVRDLAGPDDDLVAAALLRPGRPDAETALTALGSLFAAGVDLDWTAALPAGEAVGVDPATLPTYPFQRETYWLNAPAPTADLGSAGVGTSHHPLLRASVEVADGGRLFTGRLSPADEPWLADHLLAGHAVLPPLALVELALHVGRTVGTPRIGEFEQREPLVLPAGAAPRVQVLVTAAAEDGSRRVDIHAITDVEALGDAVATGDVGGARWTRYAAATLLPAGTRGPTAEAPTGEQWPPADAEPVDVMALHDELAARGHTFGPASHGPRAAWRQGPVLLAEVALPDELAPTASAYGPHPALIHAALWPVLALPADGNGTSGDDGIVPRLPVVWTQVTASDAAVGAEILRVRLTPEPAATVALYAADEHDRVVLAGTFALRPVAVPAPVASSDPDAALHVIDWKALPEPATDHGTPAASNGGSAQGWQVVAIADRGRAGESPAAVTDPGPGETPAPAVVVVDLTARRPPAGETLVAETHTLTASVLALARNHLTDPRFARSRLLVVTRGAVAASPTETVTDLPGAAVWGLLRAAEAEYPGRIGLADIDIDLDLNGAIGLGTDSAAGVEGAGAGALLGAFARGESQFAVRGSEVRVPRLVALDHARVPAPGDDGRQRPLDPDGTVLITGGTGTLGGLLARQLVTAHGIRHLLLASRQGTRAEGVVKLVAELRELGAEARVVEADLADRDQVAALLGAVDADHPLTAVVHAAGLVRDRLLADLAPDDLAAVLAPKVDGAWNLYELTAGMDLAAFVLYSSAVATLGNAGQANYAAANAFLDALAGRARAAGRAAVSLAWGLWEQRSGVSAGMGAAARRRLARAGLAAMGSEEALGLFAPALRARHAVVVAARLADADEAGADGGTGGDPGVSPLFADLRTARRPAAPAATNVRRRAGARPAHNNLRADAALVAGLADLPLSERHRRLLQVVRRQAAVILGHRRAEDVRLDQGLLEAGLDSLGAVELRNRLGRLVGQTLPTTLTFDYPTPQDLAGHLHDLLVAPGHPDTPAQRQAPARPHNGVGAELTTVEQLAAVGDQDLFNLIDNELGIG